MLRQLFWMAREFSARPSDFVDVKHPVARFSIDTHSFLVGQRDRERKARAERTAALARKHSRS